MTISVTGLGSGLNYDSWITQLVAIKQAGIDKISAQATAVTAQKTALSTVQTNYSALSDSIHKFTDTLTSTNVFNQKTATSSSDAVTAAVTPSVTAQTVKVTVASLATATTAQSASSVAAPIAGSTKLSDLAAGAFKDGTFSLYVGGAKTSISITSSETMDDVLTALNNVSGVTASLSSDGKLSIKGSGTDNVTVGSSTDTGNFGNVMSLVSKTTNGVTTTSSSKSIFSTDASKALMSTSFAGGSVTAGNFTIGGDVFTVDATTTMNSLINKINASDKAGVTASWDSNSGKIMLESKSQGAVSINIEAGDGDSATADSNFTDLMGLTSGGKLATDSQTLGTNAVLTINGTQITSSSNTVTSDISGIKGLTLTLKSTTSSTASVAVGSDTSAITNALTTFVNAFNTAVTSTDSATGTGGSLHGETVLTSIRNKIRGLATTTAGDNSIYKTLASIGISTGPVSTNTKAATNKLVIDTAALTAAITANPDAVQNLLIGDKTTGSKGVLSKLDTVVSGATNASTGYFTKRESSYDTQVNKLNNKVSNQTTTLAKYKADLETKFALMDKTISNLNSQSDQMTSFFKQIDSSSSSSK